MGVAADRAADGVGVGAVSTAVDSQAERLCEAGRKAAAPVSIRPKLR